MVEEKNIAPHVPCGTKPSAIAFGFGIKGFRVVSGIYTSVPIDSAEAAIAFLAGHAG
jgi:hypothetical protein